MSTLPDKIDNSGAKKVSSFAKPTPARVVPAMADASTDPAFPKGTTEYAAPNLPEADESSKLPQPTGYQLLIIPYQPKATTKGGIQLAQSTLDTEKLASVVAYVAAVGPDAYQDERKFPSGAYCKKGDWILIARYAGSRIKAIGAKRDEDIDLRLINDDNVLAVVENPEDFMGSF